MINDIIKEMYECSEWDILIRFIEPYSLTGSFKDLLGNKIYFLNGKRHRIDGPAIEYANGGKHWYLNGKLHCVDGPAIEYANGYRAWYLNGEQHREDGPAVEYTNGDKCWYLNGKLHRVNAKIKIGK